MDKDLGDRANCENLIPLYNRNYEENKNDGLWLQRAMNRMAKKECTDDPLFVKIVEQKNYFAIITCLLLVKYLTFF